MRLRKLNLYNVVASEPITKPYNLIERTKRSFGFRSVFGRRWGVPSVISVGFTKTPKNGNSASQYFPSWCDNYRIPTVGLLWGSKLSREWMNSVEYDYLEIQNDWNCFSISPLQNNQWYQNIAAVIVGTPKTDRSVPKIILS